MCRGERGGEEDLSHKGCIEEKGGVCRGERGGEEDLSHKGCIEEKEEEKKT